MANFGFAILDRRRPGFNPLPQLRAQVRTVFVSMGTDGVLYRGLKELVLRIGGNRDRAFRIAGIGAAIDVFAVHASLLNRPPPAKIALSGTFFHRIADDARPLRPAQTTGRPPI